jgi:uncharacterized membrane protein
VWSPADYKYVFMVVGLIGVIVFSVPSALVLVRLPSGERFSELYVLGPSRMADGYPFNVSAGSTYSVFLGVGNQMGESEYYRVVVKFRNASEPLPNATEGVASSLPELYAYNVFLSDGQVWEGALNFSFSDVTFGQNVSSVGRMRVNDVWVNVDKSAVWDETKNGFYYQLFFELWIYNVETGVFQYHDRYCGIWLNMTLSSIS